MATGDNCRIPGKSAPVRRNPDGSIDTCHYIIQARTARAAAVGQMLGRAFARLLQRRLVGGAKMKWPGLLLAAGVMAAPVQIRAADVPAERLAQCLQAKIPQAWQVRVRWRGSMLVAFPSSPPYQAFDLLYHPEEQLRVLRMLRPASDEEIWTALRLDQDIALEPTVSGKGGLRVSRKDLNDTPQFGS